MIEYVARQLVTGLALGLMVTLVVALIWAATRGVLAAFNKEGGGE